MMRTALKITFVLIISIFATGAAPAQPSESGSSPSPTRGVSLAGMRFDGEAYSQTLEDGRKAVFTVDPKLQKFADDLFERYKVPAGAAVILNSKTGRVMTFSSRNERAKNGAELTALDPTPPAASLFKIVTTAALLEQSDTTLDTRTCYHGGGQRLQMHNLVDSERDDTACASLGYALGRSTNSIFAKLSDRHLPGNVLGEYARKFRFGKELPFDVPVPHSSVDISDDRLERARTAAGFWHSHLSPLHAAMIAQTIAQKGAMLRPYIIDHVEDSAGQVVYESSPSFIGRPIEEGTAASLIEAMKNTVKRGTARKSFRDGKGVPYLPGIEVAGKTGTLTGRSPYRAYSWFVALAPADKPEIAISVLVVNEPKWRIKSAPFAAQLLRKYFEDRI